jgi:propanediol utilization protein
MDATLVYEKTGSGRDAIQTGVPQLDFKSRAALIMVDGIDSAKALSEKIVKLRLSEQGLALLESLFQAGLIAPKSGAAIVTVKGPVAAVEVTAQAASFTAVPITLNQELSLAKRAGVRAIDQAMGPNGMQLALALEDAKDTKAFLAVVQRVHAILRDSLGAPVAERFLQKVSG